MILIEDNIISDDVVEKEFLCNLNACKGACCWEGEFGAPLEDEEIKILKEVYPIIKDTLTPEGRAVIEKEGVATFFEEPNGYGTPLIDGKACAFLTYDAIGIAKCGIEQAHRAGKIDFLKPISCHLYPIRVMNYDGFTAINYDSWDICSAACELGKKEELPVYKFLKEALVRKFGASFYEQLEGAAEEFHQAKKD